MDQLPNKNEDLLEQDVQPSIQEDLSQLLGKTPTAPDILQYKAPAPDQDACLLSTTAGRLQNGIPTPANHKVRTNGCPISMVSGEELLVQEDFHLPGPIPLVWQRTYRSSSARDVGLGVGWIAPWYARLTVDDDKVIYLNGEGREIEFERPGNGEGCYHALEQLTLFCDGASYRLVDDAGQITRFAGAKKRKRLDQISNSYGFSIRLHYNDANRLSSITDSVGRSLHLEYNINGHLRLVYLLNELHQPVGKPLVQYRYDNQSDLVTVIDAAGAEQRFVYEQHLLVQRTNKDGFNYYLEWDQLDPDGKCIRNWGDRNIYAYQFEYDTENRVTHSTDGRGYTTSYYYNELGLVTKEISPLGAVREWEYDESGHLLLERDPVGGETRYQYQGPHLLQVQNALDEITRFQYDELGNRISTEAPDGSVTRYEYDKHGRIVAEFDPENNVSRYQYDSSGNLLCATDPVGSKTLFEWNHRSELIRQTDVLGDVTEYFYDDFSRVTKVKQGDKRVSQYKYDVQGNVTFIIQADGSNSQLIYTAEGRLTHYIDTLGRTTQFKYDGLSQPVERIDPNGARFRYIYDPERNLIGLLNENNDRYELVYDEDQRLIVEKGFDGRVQKYKYNPAGHLMSHSDGLYRYTEYHCDALGRIVRQESSGGSWSEFHYDNMGRLDRAVNNDSEVLFAYDILGRLTDEIQSGRRIQYRYDVMGNKTHIMLPDGQLINFDYNEKGLYTCANYKSSISRYKYRSIAKVVRNSQGRETKRQVGIQTADSFSYDPMGRLVTQNLADGYGPMLQRHYRYNKAGNLTRLDDTRRGVTQFRYDALDRIKLAMGYTMEQFDFDAAGNILAHTETENTAPPDQQFPLASVKGYQVRSFDRYHFDYDDVGNMINQHSQGDTFRYFYNDRNWLVKAHVQDQVFEYKYDALGRRIKKCDTFGVTEYLWDEDVLLAEQRNRLNVLYVHEPGTHVPLCQIRDRKMYFYHNDHIGTPQILTNKKGEVVWDAHYKVFGSISKYEESFVDNPIRFQGQYMDSETGLHYNRSRYYHPELGRFVNQDPIGLMGGENNYMYAPNPLRWVDPQGMLCREAQHLDMGLITGLQVRPDQRHTPVNDGSLSNFSPLLQGATDKAGKNNMNRVNLWKLQYALGPNYNRLYLSLIHR